MRSGGLDCVVRFVRPGVLVRDGRSRVPGPDVTIADEVPATIHSGEGTERFANAENAGTAPIVILVRREPDVAMLDAGDAVIDIETGRRYEIKAVGPYSGDRRRGDGDPRRDLEILAVGSGNAIG